MLSVAFAHSRRARLLLVSLTRGAVTTLQASLDVADWSVATPSTGCRRSASTAASRPTPGASYRGPWRLPGPDLHRLAALSLALGYVMTTSLSSWRPSSWTHHEYGTTAGPGNHFSSRGGQRTTRTTTAGIVACLSTATRGDRNVKRHGCCASGPLTGEVRPREAI